MKYYEVRQTTIKVNASDYKRFGDAVTKFYNGTNLDMQVLVTFSTKQEARAFFDNISISTTPNMGMAVKYDLYEYVTIAEVDIDEDGEWLSEEDIASKISNAESEEEND